MGLKPLYSLVAQYRELERIDVEEIDEQTLADTLEALGGEIALKVTNCALFTRNLETFADTIDEAAQAMKERAERFRNKAAGIRKYVLNAMQGAGITKIQAPEFTISIRKNPAAVMIAPDARIPSEYMMTPEPPPPRPDKKRLKEALESGQAIDGCHLEQGQRIDIR